MPIAIPHAFLSCSAARRFYSAQTSLHSRVKRVSACIDSRPRGRFLVFVFVESVKRHRLRRTGSHTALIAAIAMKLLVLFVLATMAFANKGVL